MFSYLRLSAFLFVLLASSANSQAPAWEPSASTQVPIWPGKVPDSVPLAGPESTTVSEHLIAGKSWLGVINVAVPTMTVYPPKGTNTGVAVVVFPGGGYNLLAIDLEGTEICDRLTSMGITAVLLKYRVPGSGPHYENHHQVIPKVLTALQDAQRTLRLVRLHAAEWHIDPHKVGVMGFSAGGHLVAATSTQYQKRLYAPGDAADKQSCRPDFGAALYPGHMLENTKTEFELNPTLPVTRDTPPTFIVQAEDDPVDTVQNSLVYYNALRNASVPVEMYLYAEGKHGFGVRPTENPITKWPELLEKWLGTIGMLSK